MRFSAAYYPSRWPCVGHLKTSRRHHQAWSYKLPGIVMIELLRVVCICCVHVGDCKVILNEGMPQYKNPFEKGRLIITFSVRYLTTYGYGVFHCLPIQVKFPEPGFIDPSQLPQLAALLPPAKEVPVDDDVMEVDLLDIAPEMDRQVRSNTNQTSANNCIYILVVRIPLMMTMMKEGDPASSVSSSEGQLQTLLLYSLLLVGTYIIN